MRSRRRCAFTLLEPHILLGLIVTGAAPLTGRCASPDAARLAAQVDQHLADKWEKAGVKPAPVADDATFLRRVYLDLIGRIPTVAEVRAFLDELAADKRAQLIDRLLTSGGHHRHSATFWRRTWIPQADAPQFARLADGFEEWLAIRLAENTRYDRLVKELLAASVGERPRRGALPSGGGSAAEAFFAASESKPENLAANTARAFLGINLDCAQCHNHPFARWTRDQFWQTAAFFARPAPATDTQPIRLELAIPNTKKVVMATFLTETQPTWPDPLGDDAGPRVLAAWVTDKNNPFFARNAANRLWAHFFGTGLAEPLDDLSGDNPPSHPELLDELARTLAESGFDLTFLTKALVLSKAYQLAAAVPSDGAMSVDPRLFARMPVRGLTGEQLYDSLRVAAGLPADRDDLDPVNALRDRQRVAAQFHIERPATAQRSIVQALALMNGGMTANLTDAVRTPTLMAVADAPFLDTRAKVETLFLAALGRRPRDQELGPLVSHVERGGAHHDSRKALADVFWALLNGSEFSTNH